MHRRPAISIALFLTGVSVLAATLTAAAPSGPGVVLEGWRGAGVEADTVDDEATRFSVPATEAVRRVWDGGTVAEAPLHPTGLGGIDLTAAGSLNGLRIEVLSTSAPAVRAARRAA